MVFIFEDSTDNLDTDENLIILHNHGMRMSIALVKYKQRNAIDGNFVLCGERHILLIRPFYQLPLQAGKMPGELLFGNNFFVCFWTMSHCSFSELQMHYVTNLRKSQHCLVGFHSVHLSVSKLSSIFVLELCYEYNFSYSNFKKSLL